MSKMDPEVNIIFLCFEKYLKIISIVFYFFSIQEALEMQ